VDLATRKNGRKTKGGMSTKTGWSWFTPKGGIETPYIPICCKRGKGGEANGTLIPYKLESGGLRAIGGEETEQVDGFSGFLRILKLEKAIERKRRNKGYWGEKKKLTGKGRVTITRTTEKRPGENRRSEGSRERKPGRTRSTTCSPARKQGQTKGKHGTVVSPKRSNQRE